MEPQVLEEVTEVTNKDQCGVYMEELADNRDRISELQKRNRKLLVVVSTYMKSQQKTEAKIPSGIVPKRSYTIKVSQPKKKAPSWCKSFLVKAIHKYTEETGKTVNSELANFIIDYRKRETKVVGSRTSVTKRESRAKRPRTSSSNKGISASSPPPADFDESDVSNVVNHAQPISL